MSKDIGFFSAEEILESANNIGDVRSIEGKERMMEFLAKSIQTIKADENAYDVVVDAYFVNFLTKSPVNDKDYYFENGKLKEGFDNIDGIIGNTLSNFSSALLYGENAIINHYTSKNDCSFRNYTPEEVEELETSIFQYRESKGRTK